MRPFSLINVLNELQRTESTSRSLQSKVTSNPLTTADEGVLTPIEVVLPNTEARASLKKIY